MLVVKQNVCMYIIVAQLVILIC